MTFKLGVPKDEVYFVTAYGCPSHDEPGAESVVCDRNLALSLYMWQEIHDGKPEVHFVSFSFSLSFFYFAGTGDGLRKRIVIKNKSIENIVDFTQEKTGVSWKLKDIYALLINEEIYTDTLKDPEIGLALRDSWVSKLSHIEDLKTANK